MAPSLLFCLPDAGAVEQETSMNRFVSVCGMALALGVGMAAVSRAESGAGQSDPAPGGGCDRGPRRTGVCWPRATGKARRGFSGRKTGRIFWSTRSHRLMIRK